MPWIDSGVGFSLYALETISHGGRLHILVDGRMVFMRCHDCSMLTVNPISNSLWQEGQISSRQGFFRCLLNTE